MLLGDFEGALGQALTQGALFDAVRFERLVTVAEANMLPPDPKDGLWAAIQGHDLVANLEEISRNLAPRGGDARLRQKADRRPGAGRDKGTVIDR